MFVCCSCFATGNYSSEPFHDQVDGNAHLIIAFDRFATAAAAAGMASTVADKYYPLMRRFLSTYVGDGGAARPSGPYLNM